MSLAASDSARNQVAALRLKLLDLSLRNRMLNYKPSKRLGITLIGTSAADVYVALVAESRKVDVHGQSDSTTEDDTQLSESPLNELPLDEEEELEEDDESDEGSFPAPGLAAALPAAVKPRERRRVAFRANEPDSTLRAKLRTIQREAQLASDELGINTLFLAVGTLEWHEADNRPHRAPLLFIPVALERQANGTIRLLHDGGDVGDNLPLRAKLTEFALRLPEYDEERPVGDYFASVRSAVEHQASWHVQADDLCIGFFNYEKYAMYQDLGGDAWPDGAKPWHHADIVALLGGGGYPTTDDPIAGVTFYDDVRPVSEAHEVYDADSSQIVAMIRAAGRESIVIEGPPGTGKSQTITNIIAEAVASGKKVLFVAAKRAAVDVVKRRLDEAGLGAMCLDIHDKLANRRAFYAEIRSTLGRSLAVREEEARMARLEEVRARLTDHSRAANEQLVSSCISPHT
jgi:hypothetical protein